MTALLANKQSITRKTTSLVSCWGYVLMVIGRMMDPTGKTLVLSNLTSSISKGRRRSLSVFIC